MMEPRDALEAILARRTLAVSAILGVAGYYARTLLISELLFAPLGGAPAYLAGNCLIALGWTALVVAIVCTSARLTGRRGGRRLELFALWGYTQVPAIILTVLTGAAVLLIPPAWRRELDVSWLILGIAVVFLLSLWGLLLKLQAVRVWSGRSGWPLAWMILAVVALYGALAWGEHIAVVERGLVPAGAVRAMEPTVTPLVVRRVVVRLPFDKLTYLVRPPRRGEIVSFVPAGRESGVWSSIAWARAHFLARIIGVPGDTVEVRNGEVFLNGRLFEEPYRVGGGNWSAPAATVQPEQYFILGDNRAVLPHEYQAGLVGASRLSGRLTDLGRTRWEFVVGKGRW
jgi:signal peptidase I